MPFVPIPNTARVELRYTQDGQQMANVFHVEKSATLTVTDLQAIGTIFVDWYETLLPLVSNSVTLREISLIDQSAASSIGIIWNTGLPLIGGSASAAMPNGTSIAIKWGTGLTGRSFRGRTFHIGLGEAEITANTLQSTFASNLLAAYNALLTGFEETAYTLVVASRYTNNAPRVTGVTTPILTAALADLTLDRQWKRMPGRGR